MGKGRDGAWAVVAPGDSVGFCPLALGSLLWPRKTPSPAPRCHGSTDIPPPSHRSPAPRSRTACDVSACPLSLGQWPGGDAGGHRQCPCPGGSQLGAGDGERANPFSRGREVTGDFTGGDAGKSHLRVAGRCRGCGGQALSFPSPRSSSPLPAGAWTGGAQPPHPSGLGALPWGSHGAAGPGPGWAATRLAWPERRAGATDNRARRRPSSHRQ